MKTVFSILLVLSCLFLQQRNAISKTHVHVVDGLASNNPPLKLHCASGDNELGWHYPKTGDDFNFSFTPSEVVTTIFFCHFWWGAKDSAFEVYNTDGNCGKDNSQICYWLVKEDGFYFAHDHESPPASAYVKKSGW
ncbi:hypothetical protein P3S67_009022 [Capsicum chacoense]|nr:putative F-box/kelch-repeat protein-like [Capsicum annuum]